jgi:hypothetical protein
VFEDEELNEQSAAVVEKAVQHGPNPVGEHGIGEVERVESVGPTKGELK